MSLENVFKSELGKEVLRLRQENREVHAAVVKKQKELLKMRGSLVTEQCPECGEENTIAWNVAKKGYHAFCPNCGSPMMLCGSAWWNLDYATGAKKPRSAIELWRDSGKIYQTYHLLKMGTVDLCWKRNIN